MNNAYAIVNQKGGVGKTTTTANLAAGLARKDKKVLLIDLDAQANASAHFGVSVEDGGDPNVIEAAELKKSMYHVLRHQTPIQEIIQKVSENLFIAPASLFLSAADLELSGVIGRELILRSALQSIEGEYDFILMDCPPSLGVLSVNGLVAASKVIVPVQSEYLALHGVRQLLDTVDQVRAAYNPRLSVGGVLLCLHDSRRRLSRSVADTVKEYFGDLVFDTIIRTNVALAEAPASGESIFDYDPRSSGAEDYGKLVEEVISRGA